MARRGARPALVAAAAALLLAAMGRLSELRQSYAGLVAATQIHATFVGDVSLQMVPRLAGPEFASGVYYEGVSNIVEISLGGMNLGAVTMSVTNDIGRFTGGGVEVEYADGYDESCMGAFGQVLVISRGYAEARGLANGDTVTIAPDRLLERIIQAMLEARMEGNMDMGGPGFEELYAGILEEAAERHARLSLTYVVAGIADLRREGFAHAVYTPGHGAAFSLFGPLDALEVTLADSETADEYRAFALGRLGAGAAMVMDTSKLENLRNTKRLIDMLYPIAAAAAVMIGCFVCCLAVLQTSKEAAIMRVLGAARARVLATVLLEQAFLCLAGLALGVAAGLAMGGGTSLPFAASYFAVVTGCNVACALLMARRPPLELLQFKE